MFCWVGLGPEMETSDTNPIRELSTGVPNSALRLESWGPLPHTVLGGTWSPLGLPGGGSAKWWPWRCQD